MKPMHKDRPKGCLFQNRKPDPVGEGSITKYLPLVRFVAEKIHRRLPPGVDLESLVHSGVVGLLEALDRFDPKRGVEFEAFARYRIQGEVMQCLRSLDWVSRSVRSWGRKIESVRSKLVGRLVREPNAEEMAKELDIPLETYFRLDRELNEATLLSIEDLSIASEAAWERTQQKYAVASFLDPLRFVEGKDLAEKLAVAVDGLPKRERMLITLYYHEELTLREIGDVFHLSEGRVSQILAQAVGRLREALGVTVNSKNNSVTKHSTGVRKARELKHQPVAEPIIQRRWNRRRIYVSHRYRNKFEKGGTLTIGEAKLSNALAE